jgi:hypothetical protein
MDSYLGWMRQTLASVHGDFYVFCDPALMDRVHSEVVQSRGAVHLIPIPLEELEAHRRFGARVTDLLASEDFRAHKKSFDVPEHMHASYTVLMFQKLRFMQMAHDMLQEKSKEVNNVTKMIVWMDAGLVRDVSLSGPRAWPGQAALAEMDRIKLFAVDDAYDFDACPCSRALQAHVLSQRRFTQGCCFIVGRCRAIPGHIADSKPVASIIDLGDWEYPIVHANSPRYPQHLTRGNS